MAKDILCNVCGRKLKRQGEDGSLLEDVFDAKKEWGYFSKKDRVRHHFYICEDCYDAMVAKFVIPPEEEEVIEL